MKMSMKQRQSEQTKKMEREPKKKQFTSPLAINKSIDEVLTFQYLYSCVRVTCATHTPPSISNTFYASTYPALIFCYFLLLRGVNVIFPKDLVFFAYSLTTYTRHPSSLLWLLLTAAKILWQHSYKFVCKSNLAHLFIIFLLGVIYGHFERLSANHYIFRPFRLYKWPAKKETSCVCSCTKIVCECAIIRSIEILFLKHHKLHIAATL